MLILNAASTARHVNPRHTFALATEDPDRIEAFLMARTYLYTLFHKTFGGEPSNELVEAISSCATADALSLYATGCDACAQLRLFGKTLSRTIEYEGYMRNVRLEYKLLLSGNRPRAAVPRKALHLGDSGNLSSETPDMAQLLKERGLHVKCSEGPMYDHIALISAFSAVQAHSALKAFRTGSWMDLANILTDQEDFIRNNLTSWIPDYAKKLNAYGPSYLYPPMAAGLAAFVMLDEAFCRDTANTVLEFRGSRKSNETPSDFLSAELNHLRDIRLRGLEEYELLAP